MGGWVSRKPHQLVRSHVRGCFCPANAPSPPPESKLSRSGEVPPTVGGQRMGIQGPLGRLMLGTIEKLEQSAQVELLTPAMPESTV